MEYVKNILTNINNGQAEKGINNSKNLKIIDKIKRHRFIITVTLVTISFTILDLILIFNFINVLKAI